jgi:hypothetical protein
MAKEKLTEVESIADKAPPTFEVVGFKKSEQMLISIDGRQVNLAHPTPELTAWLYERREKLSGLRWKI